MGYDVITLFAEGNVDPDLFDTVENVIETPFTDLEIFQSVGFTNIPSPCRDKANASTLLLKSIVRVRERLWG